jgi:hypothetical protein
VSGRACDGCGAAVHDGVNLCAQCATTLDVALGNIAAYQPDLDTIRAKRARYGGGASKGSIGKAQPLPVDMRFLDRTGVGSQLDWDAKNTIVAWTRIVLDTWTPAAGPTCRTHCLHASCNETLRRAHPRDNVGSCVNYLAGHRHGIAAMPWAGELLDEMLDLERRLRRMVDRPADAWYAGECGSETDTDYGTVTCTRELYAVPGSPFVQCRDCGCTYDVAARRKTLLNEAEDREVTVRMMARIVTTLGAIDASEARLEGRINVWVTRGRLLANGKRVVDGRPRPVYRVGDVLDLLSADAEAKGA